MKFNLFNFHLYPADFASLTSFFSLSSDSFAWGYRLARLGEYGYSGQPVVPSSKLNEGSVQEKIYSKKLCFNFTIVPNQKNAF